MAIESWTPTKAECDIIREALELVWARAWRAEELTPILRLKAILSDPTGGMHLWYDGPLCFETPEFPFKVTADQLEEIHAKQAVNAKVSSATTEYGVYRHKATGDLYQLRVEHGGEDNGEASFISGFSGPYRPTTDPERLLTFKDEYQRSSEQLAWAEEQGWEKLDLVF